MTTLMESCPAARWFQVHSLNRAKKRHTKASQYFVTLDLVPSNARQECVATALTICLLLVLYYAQTAKFMQAQVCVGDMRVSRLQVKGRRHHLSQNISPTIAGSARPKPQGDLCGSCTRSPPSPCLCGCMYG